MSLELELYAYTIEMIVSRQLRICKPKTIRVIIIIPLYDFGLEKIRAHKIELNIENTKDKIDR